MKKILNLIFLPLLLIMFAAGTGGCEIIEEALEAGALDTDNPNSDDYRPRFVIGIFSIVQYPRATDLEKPIRDLDGREIYINANQNFSSKNLKDARIVVRPGNPELCDLKLKLDRRGKIQWQADSGMNRSPLWSTANFWLVLYRNFRKMKTTPGSSSEWGSTIFMPKILSNLPKRIMSFSILTPATFSPTSEYRHG